ncbi:MAG TPA: non-ribosomal peptide synthase/polyketide synthase [Longimicrobium sp.]|uniref:non-ribosomal peptide synthase/polyketide synthase n=1 Tax=Longimicrobium sp. TaxID=2029185 RepID=UPI002ED7C267
MELLRLARARKLVGERSELPPIVPAARDGGLPLSFAQERLWFIDQLEPGSATYTLPAALRLTGALDERAVERSLREIVRRHEALRTVFAEADGSPVQVIAPFAGFSLPVEDLSGLGEADRETAVGRRAGEEAARPFDLATGPLFRAALLRLGAEDHVLLLSMHHIVSDGWSMGVLSREFSVLYEAYRDGRESPLPELAVQYADYAVWQREQLASEVLDRQLAYWRERLAGAPELLELPGDHPRPAVQSHRGATVPVELSAELLERLQALGRKEGATLYMVALAAFQVLLSKYSGSEDVVVGSPIAGRERDEVKGLIGFFVNTLVLRTNLSGDPSFRAVLGRVREVTLGAYEHQEVPFEKLVAELSPERSLSHSPLFQVAFTLDNAQGTGGRFAGLGVREVETEFEVAKFDLSLSLAETAQGLRGGLSYATDLFERGTIERMLGHLARVLEQVAADADVRLSLLALTGPEERARVVGEWNRTERPYPRGVCIHELFDAQVRERPGAVALVWGEESLTYRELDARANQLANHLAGLSVGPDARVGVLLERSAELVVSMLAVLKAGGAYVPLDPGYPPERLRLMLADSSVRVLLTRGDLAGVVEGGGLDVVHLDQVADALASESPEAPVSGATAENLAYIVYTSGSTGKPKGVMVAHRHVVQLVVDTDYVRFHPGDRVAQASNASFDALTFEAWGAFLNGATLVGIPRDVLLSPPALREMLREERITTLYQTTALLNQLSREQPDVFAPLREVLFGGQAVDPGSVRRLLKAGGPERLLHMYGPTETTAWCSWEQVEQVAEDALTVSVGRPTGNQRIYLLDSALNPLPVGVPGEAYVGGDGVVRGYLDRPGLTAERFLPDPFAAEPGARMYRTGDRLRWIADGRLEFIGRVDAQVKVRGFRIEPGEIEATLTAHADVQEARVIVREDVPGEQRLVAYVVGGADAEALRAHLRLSLPDYMVPGAFVSVERLPLTPAGKLDVRALPAPEYASAEDRYVAPRNPVEEVLAGIWAEVLRLERAGVTESFFDLGGHSLLATRVVSRVRELFGVELPLRAFFEGPTVAELAGRVEELRREGGSAALPPLVPVGRDAPLPLSFAQERLWFLQQMEPEGAGYNMPWSRRLRGSLDAGALERALGELVSRHEALRTTFQPVEQGAVQVIHPAAPAELPVLDLTELAPEVREQEARRLAREDAECPFDLERGPLLRATLVRLSGEEHVLLLTMHHIVSDGWSMGVLFRELFTLYESFSPASGAAPTASTAPPLPPLAVQYADFAVWQRGWLQGDVLQRQLDWWRERLGGAPPALELPTDRPRPAVASSRGAALMLRLPADVTRGLRALARREGATLYMVTHAALDLLLSRWSGQEDLVVGSPIAGRTQVGTEGLIGFFINTLALRIDLSGDPSFQELVRRVRETALGAYAHQELPFERLVEEVAPERGLSHTPLFQVMFALQNADTGGGAAVSEVRLEPFGGEVQTVHFDLELDLREVGEEMFGSLRFRTDLFDAATMGRFAEQYGAVLAAAAAAPEERLSRLSILPEPEARTLLEYGSGPAREDACVPVHHLFGAQAARTPEAPALLFAGESLTYAELDARAERLARRLRARALPGATIAVCLERGPQAVVALLAVWKMGGVYLPMDPGHPVERLAFFLHDSGAKLVVSDLPLAGALVAREADVQLLDSTAQDVPDGELELHGDGGPGGLAYLIYTSGSTGTPKAVMVEHAHLAHTLGASLETLGFAPGDVVAALASTAFDISLLELLTPLLAGGGVRIVPPEVARDPETLVEAAADVSVLHAVPALMRQVVEVVRGGRMLSSLRLLLVGGDTVAPDLLEDMREVFPAARTRVLYGPTEATIICATYAVPAEGAVAGHPLGRPLPGVRLAVRGPRGEMSPVGVPGEVWISGGGVARGYLGRPELNAEKFVGIGAERAYRTGDRARWRADGVLEFLGRADEQVKVRGFRIEPGEIEAVLRGEPGVREAVVLAREDAPGDRRLVAYVVPGSDGAEAAGGRAQVSEWETLFDDTYAQDEEDEDPTLQLKGWNSSYTGEPIPREEMRAWVEDTADRILALRPERVLEVGCGTGLLLFRVAPHTRAYHGTDFSGVALEHVRRHAAGLPQVSLSEAEADRLDGFVGAEFDLVVVNSVAQYFPDLDYLLRVLEGAAAALRLGGRIFVGDVRSLPLAGAFHASVELARSPDGLPAAQLQARVRRGIAEEQELLVDQALFEAVRARMPRLGRVEVQVKRGEYDNEVSRFRYDVVLHLDVPAAASAPVVHEWSGEDVSGLRALAEESASALLVRGVPDARVREHVCAYELVSRGRDETDAAAVRALAARDAGGIAPEALFALAGELGREIEVRPGASGTLDVLVHPAGDVAHVPAALDAERPWESYANDPQWGRRMRALVPALREAARARLPEYMVPSAFVVLEAFPVTPNGKVDRAALPAPDTLGSGAGTYVAPRTPAEERMAAIWAEVLGVERVGGEDNFFDLGGHSLLATQLVSRVRETFGTELPLRAVFEAPTLAELAGRVEALRAETLGDASVPPVVPVPRDGSPLPLSFAQERLWFIDRLEPGSTAYNLPGAWRLGGALDHAALERTLGEIVRRHEALRTVFAEVDGSPVQVIAPFAGFELPVEDLSGLSEADRAAAARRRTGEEALRPFDLAAGPLFRAALLRLGADDHLLLISMHHIVSDGWSMGVLFGELSALYEAFARGDASPLPELPVQYADYAVWQRERAGEVLDRQLAYWRERMAGAPELLELPSDHPRAAVQTFRGATVPVELSAELLERLQALGRSEGATLYMTLLSAFQVLLGRYAGSDDVVVGSPIAGRTRGEVEGLIGFFVNTLVLRTDLSGDPGFRDVLRQVREATLGAYAHQEVPFERLVAELQPERSLSHSPLFQVMFTLQDVGSGGAALPGLEVSGGGAAMEVAKFDLSLTLAATPQGLRGGLNYSTDLFERGTVERLLGHLERVLEQVAADADVRLSRLELLSADERGLVVDAWNRTEADYSADGCIHEQFEAQAARTPDAVAVRFREESLTYGKLNERANRLAHHLAGLGVGAETRVAICLEPGPEMVVSVLAVLKAGGAYVPLDPAYPAERLAFMLADAAVPVLVTQESLRAALSLSDGVAVVSVDRDSVAAKSAENPERSVSPGHLAYVIYTSGSTGTPKGVLVQHGSLANLLATTREAFGVDEGDLMPAMASYAFDIWLFEALLPLTSGAAVRLVERERVMDVPALVQEIADATLVHAVPALMRQLVQAERETPRLARLRRAFVGGDRVAADLLAEMREALPGAESHVLYGPTEGTILASTHPVDGVVFGHPIGRPLGNVRLYVCNVQSGAQPVGVPGELLIGGAGVARGYLGRPGLTAERFIPDPFSADPGARLYRTGDRARWRADGTLEFLGRVDTQVKVRGFRIEPGEIEAVLRAHEDVTDCVVVAREDAGDQRLVAYVTGGVEAEELREHLRRSLPEYMVPAAFVVLDALPLTPNGKLDRKALPAPDYAAQADQYLAPRTPAEEVLAGIWAEVLRLEQVGVTESFFELGGHSLLATRVVSAVREAFGVELPLRALFEGPTVAELAGRVEEMRRAELPVLPAVVPVPRTGPLPLSFAQERLWFIDRLEPGSALYNMPMARRLEGALDVPALERTLSEIVRRHEALRTVFREVDGSPVQVIAPFAGFAVPMEDLSALGAADREAALRRRAVEEAQQPFDLSAGPLFRAVLLRLGAEDHVLLLSMHHIVSDGWSMGVLYRELSALYAAYRDGRESPLPELPVQYADYAVWQREQLEGEALDRQLAYWKERLAGAPELLEVPTDHPRPAVQTYRGTTVPVEFSLELLERLQALGRSEGATLYMTLLAAFQVLLGKYAGSDDVVVGTAIAGRTRGEVEELIGFFVNTLVLRTDLGGDPGFRTVLRRVREATLGAYAHQEVPFEKLVAELQPERSLSHSPLFQVMFALQNAESGGGALPEVEVSGFGAATENAQFDLSLELAATPQGLRGGLNYSTDLFERGTMVRMLGHLQRVLAQVAADADVRLSGLELLGPAEREQVLEAWNDTAAAYPADRCIHELFEAQVARSPDAVAVRFGDESLTYRELDARANRLAHYLAGLGAGPEVRVGICLERSLETVVATLAVLKSGACCVPVDTTYPPERMALMLADSAVRVLLSEGELAAPLAGSGLHVVLLDQVAEVLAAEPDHPLSANASAGNLAYVFYTSGSTGRPKGVMMAHREVVQYAAGLPGTMPIGPSDRVAQASNASFDAAVFEIWGALLNGATLVGIERDVLLSAPLLGDALRERGITHLYQTAALFNQHVREQVDVYASLRQLVFGAEAVGTEGVRTMLREGKPARVLHEYGPTEATVWCTLEIVDEVEENAATVSIGRPIPNARAYVVEPAGEPLPVGVPGELCIGGHGVVRGYLGRPGQTAERFIPDPFASEPGARMYRTGDRARWRAEGKLEFMGRLDDQVKIRGFRIEPGEVEAAIVAYPGVREARVTMREDQPGDKRLVAYLVGDAEAAALREHLLRALPEYMVPSAFVPMDRLPLTPNGKLDRKALPVPEGDAYARGSYEAPVGEVEAALAEIWGEVLGLEKVGRWDHFFELGGHSLLAVKLIERMRRAGLYMEVRALFTTPVLAELALAVGGASSDVEVPANGIPEGSASITPEMLPLVELSQAEIDGIVAMVPGGAANVQDIYPLAPLQEGILFHHLMSEDGDPYLLSNAAEFDTRARLDHYLGALQAVIDRHDVLRTAVAWEGLAEPVQVVWRRAPMAVEEVQLAVDAGDAAAELWRRFDPRHYQMDLGQAPLLRSIIAEDRASGRWLLLILRHHLTSDHESLEVLQEEVSAHLRGRESELPAALPFRNYVAQARLGVSREEHERFFGAMLGDVEEPTAPYGLLDVWGEGRGIGEARLPLAGDLGARLRSRARALGVSAASLCHLAWAQVLARLTGRRDVVFGTVFFGRMQGGEGADRVMGPFINTLPVRIGVAEEGAEAAVRRTHALLADLLRHEHASLALAQRSSGVAAPAPLFTSLLNYRHGTAPKRSPQAAQASENVRGLRTQERTNYPVMLSVDDMGEEFSLGAQVAAPADAERVCHLMHTALERLVEALELAPGRAVGSLDVLPEAEREQVLQAWNRTEAEYPADRCIHALFEAQAARAPGSVAAVYEGEALSYAELNARANQLAHSLRRRGVGPEVRVGICLERGLEMVVSILAVLKAGGAYVPLDPGYPAERLSFILSDSATPLLLTRETLRGVLPALEGVQVVSLDGAAEEIAAESPENPESGAGPDSLAYVIYTSGSTGTPKGALIEHRNVARLFSATDAWFGFGPDDVWTLFHSYAFDFSVWELWGALLHGGRVVVVPFDVSRDPEAFHALVQREGVTVLNQTPSAFRQFIRADGERGGDLALRVVVFGGEALEPASLREWVERRGIDTPRLVNMYGITETTVHVTYRPLGREDVFGGSGSPIGVRIPDLQLYVCDPALRPQPVGVPGELYVGGGGVARGYLNRPELTAQRFVENPFGAGKLYRTGDRVRWQADGTLEYLGRLDEQVKIRGFRIELGEIEARLAEYPEVREAVVLAREDVPGDHRLVAYVVGGVDADALREHLRLSLPEYMVPSAFVALDALPLTANGKLDRKALPAPEGDAYGRRSYEAPLGEVEAALAGIWAEVLGVEKVGRWDHFFELGGHSLLAVKLIGQMRRAGLYMEVRALFTTPVLAELALAVGRASTELQVPANGIPQGSASITPEMLPLVDLTQQEIDGIVAGVPGGASNVQDIYPLAPLQEGILFHYLLSQEGDPYLLSSITEFDTRARLDQYLAALQAVIHRHDILRTAVAWEGLGEPVQVVLRHAPLPVDEVQLDADGDAAGQLWRRYDPRHYRMDLGRAPLMRACIAEDDGRGRWLLLMLAHHVTGDHASLEVQQEEVTAHLVGRESELPAPLPFRNYVAQARLGVSRDEHERFFTGMLADVEEPTAPYGLLDVWGSGLGIGEAWLPVADDLSARLRRRARALGVSAASLCHLAWAQVLARLTGRQDVVFGTLLFGRMQGGEGAERVMGPFINTLPVRIGVGEEGAEAAVRRTHALMADLLRHEHASLALAQRSSGVAAPAPLFTSLLNYRHGGAPKRSQDAGPAAQGIRGVHGQERTNYPVVLSVDDWGEAFSLNAQVAAPAEAKRVCHLMHAALEQLVDALEATPGRAIGSLDVLPEAERRQVVDEWNRTDAEYPAGASIHGLFEAQAERTPDAVAVRFEDEHLTYTELNARANRLAHHLRAMGVGPEVRVGVLMERSLEMVVSLMAVLKAGGGYVPLDPGLPAERLAYMLDDSAVPLVLVQDAIREAVPARDGVRVLAVDALAERLAANPAENPAAGAGPDSLAYVIYTSGSTGRPKGVMNQHRGVVNRLVWMQAHFGIGADDVVLQKTPFSFDVSVWEFFWPLQQGACLVMARPDGHRDPLYLQEVIERRGVTTLHFVPSMLQPFVETVEAGRCASLRNVVCSGEALPPALVERFYDRFAGPVVLTNLYGPTEAAVDVSCWTCPRDGAAGVVPIGRPVWNTRLYVLDAALRPVPVGTDGELYIGGVQVARGYLDRPGLTAERFVPDPFSAEGGARLYRTGDRARWRTDGAIEYLGRLDFQVKIRGFRIELGEIEGALRRSELVADCVVVAREDAAGEKRLVAYVVGDAEAGVLREHLLRELPEYMVPAAFVALDALPLTPNGKLDRKALPAPEGDAYARGSYEAPLGEVEAALAEIWAEVLGVDRVGRWDHFFELGGHSLLAVKLVERMRRVGLYMEVRALFTTPVLAELALAVGRASSDVKVPANAIPEGSASITPEMLPLVELSQSEIDAIVAKVPGGAANVQDIYPLAPLQEGILFHHLMSEEGDPYLLSSVTEFDTRARLDQHLAALQAVIGRHDVLRTAIAWEGLREPVQVVLRHAPLPVDEVQLDADGDAAGQLWRRYDPRHYRMDVARAPLLRACVAEDRACGRWLLLMLMHHLAGDHESLEVQREEITAHLLGRESELPAPLPFRNYVAQARLGVSREEHERFFRGMLADVEEPTAPYGMLDVWGEGHGIGEAWLPVAGEISARLRRRARALGVSAASLCHLAWAQVLARVSGRSDVVFGTLLFGRMQGGEGADRVMGPFINTLPVRIGVGEEGAEAAVRRTHALLADLLRHEHASLALAQRSSGVAAPAPLFTSLLNYRYVGGGGRSSGAGQAREEGVRAIGGQERTNYPVALAVDDWGEDFSLAAQVAAPAEAERVCRLMHTALERLVEALEATPGRAIGSIGVLPEAERTLVLEEWNRTAAEVPADRCIHELFEAQAARTPGAVAVVFEGSALTYDELNRSANRLAHHLRGLGVGPDARVAICVERGPEMIAGLLAILKAGGGYVPLDPAYPAGRLRSMLEDSAPAALVTRSSLAAAFAGVDLPVVELDDPAPAWADGPETNPAFAGLTPGHLAYVIYTSGSTGRPKGVMVEHRSLVNHTAWQAAAFGIGAGDTVLQRTSISFDASVWELWTPLATGARMLLLSADAARDPGAIGRAVEEGRVTVAQFVPTLLQAVLGALPGDRSLPCRVLFCGGEPLSAALVQAARAAGAGEVVNLYGPTEATIDSTSHVCGVDGRAPAIGRPVANARIYVLDARGEPAPVGVAGELYVGGAGVARGYLGRAGLTAERFVPDPFSGESGARMYRTGDLGRWRADGTLEFLGRTDFQVKVRGFRIEPGEVEAAIRQHESVAECVVVARADAGETRLVAYVVGEAEAEALRAHLRRSLPEYMVPSAFVSLEALPLTPNGKLDRRALPAPELASAAQTYVAPRTPVEEVLAEIWAEVLRLERVGVHDSFFDLGGHSLLIMRLLAVVQTTFNQEISIRTVFSMPTLEAMAGEIERRIYEDVATMSEFEAKQLAESNPVAGV